MKKKNLLLLLVAISSFAIRAHSITPDSCIVRHNDGCWYITLNYMIDKLPKNDELILHSQICGPDTCISSGVSRFQGKRYAKDFKKMHGYKAASLPDGMHHCTLIIPEESVADSLFGITYSEYTSPQGTVGHIDSIRIFMPECPPMQLQRINAMPTAADYLAQEHPYICSMRSYKVLRGDSMHIPHSPMNHVHYPMNSARLEKGYMNNSTTLDSLVSYINRMMQDNRNNIESIQIIGYTAPDHRDEITPKLGYKRALSMRDHLMHRCNLPAEIFEVADGGKNWEQIYSDIAALRRISGDSLIRALYNEPNTNKRLAMLRNFEKGDFYNAINNQESANMRGACCTRIYYINAPDSVADELNKIVEKVILSPHPDYHRLSDELKIYSHDPRSLNLQGVIDYRRHRRSAAEEAFIEAAMQGDEQAALNLQILENNKE